MTLDEEFIRVDKLSLVLSVKIQKAIQQFFAEIAARPADFQLTQEEIKSTALMIYAITTACANNAAAALLTIAIATDRSVDSLLDEYCKSFRETVKEGLEKIQPVRH